MKNKYNIKFKHGINYRGEIDILILKLIEDKPQPKRRMENFNNALENMNKRTLRQLRNFISRESFDLHSEKPGNIELKKVLEEMLPSLFLRKNKALLEKLSILGFNSEIKNLFLEKKKLDQGISELLQKLNLDISKEPIIRVSLYSILNVKLRLKTQEALGFGYFKTEDRYITETKDKLEKLQRCRREGKKIDEKDLNRKTKKFVEYLNSDLGKEFIDRNNEIASQNHEESYNVKFLANQLLYNLRMFTKKKVSTRQLLLSLYDLFRIVYTEKNLYGNEEEWTKGKNSIAFDK